ncbi:NDR1/HIN1-like protein 13 [Rutidosis leptorrhynchoides]|uniref:NDR1/HIN1-like protein 13 n=1 Tax=Rutidosis leptorrhynchoides TaxID=125765 RepID=UPI003A991566
MTWFAAIFCAIFWVLVILGGIIVLIVYLVFRPRSPRFDVSTATLNAAYLDVGNLLNADLTVLANFTNPNKKVSVDFSYVTLDVSFANTLIATRYVPPFKAKRADSMLADVHMVTSQVRLSVQESELLKRQIANNRVKFEVRGIFHARSTLGNILGYSYKLYTTCNIELTGPPTGVLRSSKCKTKR